jgi:t-SNARE complex subunit (syntaxin)
MQLNYMIVLVHTAVTQKLWSYNSNLKIHLSTNQKMWGETSTDKTERNVQSNQLEHMEEEIDSFSKKVYNLSKRDFKKSEKDKCVKHAIDISHKLTKYTQEFQGDSLKLAKIKKLTKQFNQINDSFTELKESKLDKQPKFHNEHENEDDMVGEVSDSVLRYREMEVKQQQVAKLTKTQEATLNVEMAIAMETRNSVLELEEEFKELHGCFRDLEELVNEQQVQMDTIEENVTDANSSTEVAVQSVVTAGNRTIVKGTTNVVGAVAGAVCTIQ